MLLDFKVEVNWPIYKLKGKNIILWLNVEFFTMYLFVKRAVSMLIPIQKFENSHNSLELQFKIS